MYTPFPERYEQMDYSRCGRSGLLLPRISFGLWHSFGSADSPDVMRDLIRHAFDAGITHFDLANNYGPEPGSAERNFGQILHSNLADHRDELIVSTKAGHAMWPGPYGDWGSRKSLLASLDQSLRRMKLDYVDIFYSHRPDPNTPLEETLGALSDAVRQGKALYVGISKYSAELTRRAAEILRSNGTPLLIHQFRYNMFTRDIEADHLLDTLADVGAGGICFSPLAQGLLTNRYFTDIPSDSRAARNAFLKSATITDKMRHRIITLNDFAASRGYTLAELALLWVLRDSRVTSVLLGASRVAQLKANLKILKKAALTAEDVSALEALLRQD